MAFGAGSGKVTHTTFVVDARTIFWISSPQSFHGAPNQPYGRLKAEIFVWMTPCCMRAWRTSVLRDIQDGALGYNHKYCADHLSRQPPEGHTSNQSLSMLLVGKVLTIVYLLDLH